VIYDWYKNIAFAHPQFFGLLLLLPIMILWYITGNNKQQGTMVVSSIGPFGKADSWKTFFRHTPFVLRMLGIVALIIALARPQTRNDEQIIAGQGIDIILCMDVSGSMLAQDFLPNRLEAMKQVAVEFVEKRPTDRIGLVIFAGESFTVCPITTDRSMLKSHIMSAQSSFLADGTAIGDGLSTSVERLRGSKAKSKVIILLTDGENQGGLIDPLTAKEIAKSEGVKVYTVGMGTEGYASAPMQSETGQVTIQKQKVNIDEPLLRQIAGETGGLYFRARDNTSLQNIYTEIDKLEKTKVDISVLKRYTEQFLPFAIAAAFFILLELVLRYTIFKKFP
jgi:Ca-activated chloride channel family protein